MTPNRHLQAKREQLASLLQSRLREQTQFPMSKGQQGIWFSYHLDPLATPYNVFVAKRLRRPLDVDRFQQMCEHLVERHPSLRTTFHDQGDKHYQQVHAHLPPSFVVHDSSHLTEESLRRRAELATQIPFQLETGPLLRFHVYRIHASDWVVLAVTHHIAVDFWSLVIMVNELNSLSANSQLPSRSNAGAAAEYRDFVAWQSQYLQSETGLASQAYWKSALVQAPTWLELPLDYERPARFISRADTLAIPFLSSTLDPLRRFTAAHRVTAFSVLLSALQVFLARLANQEDFLIGVPFTGRSHEQFANTVGFFVNMLPIRSALPQARSFLDLVQQVSRQLETSMEHQAYPLATIIHEAQPARDPSRSPLFQVACTFERSQIRKEHATSSLLFPTSQESSIDSPAAEEGYFVPTRSCRFDLEFILEQTDHSLHGMICFAESLFARETIEGMGRNFASLLIQLLHEPELPLNQVPWETAAVRATPILMSSASECDAIWLNQLREHANRNRHSLAIQSQEQRITFGELLDAAHAIASSDTFQDSNTDQPIPVIGAKGPIAVACLASVLMSGRAMAPIESEQPVASLHALVQMLDYRQLVVDDLQTTSKLRDLAVSGPILEWETISNASAIKPSESRAGTKSQTISLRHPEPQELAYVVFTSGSTGRPKGVEVEWRAINNTMAWRHTATPLSSDDRVLMLLSHQFDAGMFLSLFSLSCGACLVFPDTNTLDLDALIAQIRRDKITILPGPPNLIMGLVQHPEFSECTSLREIWSGGSAMPLELPYCLSQKSTARLLNFYGPTEAAVEASFSDVTWVPSSDEQDFAFSEVRPRRIPIGLPIRHTEMFVLDANLQVLPEGVPGQLAIAGPGLARGYRGDDAATRAQFVEVDSLGQRVYLTGDIGRKREDGQFEFLGRADHQVKVNGYRLELEEIEDVLRRFPNITEVALVTEGPMQQTRMAACIVPEPGSRFDANALLDWLATQIPSYKHPHRFVVLQSLPKTPSGKIDRTQLASWIAQTGVASEERPTSNPQNAFELELARQWLSQLGLPSEDAPHFNVDSHFFAIGGDSLQAALLANRMSERLGVRVPTALLFDLLSLRQMGNRLLELYPQALASFLGETPKPLRTRTDSLLFEFHPQREVPTLFMVHPPGGIVICYRELAGLLHEVDLIGVRSRGLYGDEALPSDLEAMAKDYLDSLKLHQPKGPYLLGGWSLGGIIAYEVARLLIDSGDQVAAMVLLDTSLPETAASLIGSKNTSVGGEYGIDLSLEQLGQLTPEQQLPFLWEHAQRLGVIRPEASQEVVQQSLDELRQLFHHHVQLVNHYRVRPLSLRTILFRPQETPFTSQGDDDRGWSHLVDRVEVHWVPGHHHSMVQNPHVQQLAKTLDNLF